MAEHNDTGAVGERIAAKWLKSSGFAIIERNYREKWGEIDIIAAKDTKTHFVEVKTVSYETLGQFEYAISHETWRPEEMVHREKIRKLGRAIETWIEKRGDRNEWQFDVIALRIVPCEKIARVNYIDNILVE